jgi:hydroxylamine reductase (hybrid-cluster protein)
MKNTACAVAKGVCGKTAEVSDLQDLVLHVCKGIGFWAVKAAEKGVYDEDAAFFVDRMLFATITNANFPLPTSSAGSPKAWLIGIPSAPPSWQPAGS